MKKAIINGFLIALAVYSFAMWLHRPIDQPNIYDIGPAVKQFTVEALPVVEQPKEPRWERQASAQGGTVFPKTPGWAMDGATGETYQWRVGETVERPCRNYSPAADITLQEIAILMPLVSGSMAQVGGRADRWTIRLYASPEMEKQLGPALRHFTPCASPS